MFKTFRLANYIYIYDATKKELHSVSSSNTLTLEDVNADIKTLNDCIRYLEELKTELAEKREFQ